jgi:cellulose synthase/poly-beta-1,6-N-acetylglucosamine synthase-like glycosyltransferase
MPSYTASLSVLASACIQHVSASRKLLLAQVCSPQQLCASTNVATCKSVIALTTPQRARARAGHWNVIYIGDRIKRGQLNGKSANLNHAIMAKIHAHARSIEDIPNSDILMIMDCDHMVKPDIFLKMGACMRDPAVAVTLVPQARILCMVEMMRHAVLGLTCLVCMST